MHYDPDRQVAVLSNGREYVPAVFQRRERSGGGNPSEPCTKDWRCGKGWMHEGACSWE